MTKNLSTFSALLASLIFIGVLIGLISLGIHYLKISLEELPRIWLAVLVAVLFTAVFCTLLISNALKNNLEKRNLTIVKDRLDIYQQYLKVWLGEGLLLNKNDLPFQLNYLMGLLASDGVLKQHKKIIELHSKYPDNLVEKEKAFERLILEMRRDLGQQNFAILQGDLKFIFDKIPTKKYAYETEETYTTT